MKIGVVLSGGQAPGGHNVISGIFGEDLISAVNRLRFEALAFKNLVNFFPILCIFVLDYLQQRTTGSTMYGFRGGPAGVMKGKYVELSSEYVYPYRNQVFF